MASISSGRTVVTTAGTPVQLSATTRRVRRIFVQADSGNSTGLVSLGGSATTTVPTAGSQKGIVLAAGQREQLTNVKPSDVYVDSTVNGLGVSWLMEND